jgi:hypothetical protein
MIDISSKHSAYWTRFAAEHLGALWRRRGQFVLLLATLICAEVSILCAVESVLDTLVSTNTAISPYSLAKVTNSDVFGGTDRASFYRNVRDQDVFSSVSAYLAQSTTAEYKGTTRRVELAEVSQAFFRTIGPRFIMGRDFAIDADRSTSPSEAVITEALWKTLCSAEPLLATHFLRLGGQPFTVIGVIADDGAYPNGVQVWTNTLFSTTGVFRNSDLLDVVALARLKPNVTPDLAERRIQVLYSLAHRFGGGGPAEPAIVETVATHMQRTFLPLTRALRLLTVLFLLGSTLTVVYVVFLDCSRRKKEPSTSLSLGATRSQLLYEESIPFIIALLAGSLGGVVLSRPISSLIFQRSPLFFAHLQPPSFHLIGLVGVSALDVVTLVACWLWPFWRSTSVLIQSGSSYSLVGDSSRRRRRLFRLLLVAEVALMVTTVLESAVLFQQLLRYRANLFTFDTSSLSTVSVAPVGADFDTRPKLQDYYRALSVRFAELPGVSQVAYTSRTALQQPDSDLNPIIVGGKGVQLIASRVSLISSNYIQTLGLRVYSGGLPTVSASLAPMAVVSKRFADTIFVGRDALHSRLILPALDSRPITIMAIVDNTRPNTPQSRDVPDLYLFCEQFFCGNVTFLIRSNRDPSSITEQAEHVILQQSAQVPPFNARSFRTAITEDQPLQRFASEIITSFALLISITCSVSMLAFVSMAVRSRLPELGLRIALGASAKQVMISALRESVFIVLGGMIVGSLAAVRLENYLSQLVFNVDQANYGWMLLADGLILISLLPVLYILAWRLLKGAPRALLYSDSSTKKDW